MSDNNNDDHCSSTSTELTSGVGFSYEAEIAVYFLVALLREERAAGQDGTVIRVAVQQQPNGEPLDDIIIDFEINEEERRLSLQAKRSLTISAAQSNADFRKIVKDSIATRAKPNFRVGFDRYGFVTEYTAESNFRSLKHLIEWAKGSPTVNDFELRFSEGGEASKKDISVRADIGKLLNPSTAEDEMDFYCHFVALRLDGTAKSEPGYVDIVNRLSEILVDDSVQTGQTFFDTLYRLARSGAAVAKIWNRNSILNDIKSDYRLLTVPSYTHDISLISDLAMRSISDISETIDGVHITRTNLSKLVKDSLCKYRFVNISGLPGTGKSVVLKLVVQEMMASGPVFLLKSDRLTGVDWRGFSVAMGFRHQDANLLLGEIGATGSPVLCIDGIDRVKPTQRDIITDLLDVIMENPLLDHWKVLVTSRDQSLDVFRTWMPFNIVKETGIGDVAISYLDDSQAEELAKAKPRLRDLLFGSPEVREIVRRPFFASVLAGLFRSGSPGDINPRTETELIDAWWKAGGYDSGGGVAIIRQRAIVTLAEIGAKNLGKSISLRDLPKETIELVESLCHDHILCWHEPGHTVSFMHDILFEWAFYRLLIDMGNNWPDVIVSAGEPPLLARVVSLLSQYTITRGSGWSEVYTVLEEQKFRPQWKRAWLTGPPFSPRFLEHSCQFEQLLMANDCKLLYRLLVWFQAEYTIPNPLVLQQTQVKCDGAVLIRYADALGWPSDVRSWQRLLKWLISILPSKSTKLIEVVVELFKVWQNVFAEIENELSEKIIELCSVWLVELEQAVYPTESRLEGNRWIETSGTARTSRKTLMSSLREIMLRAVKKYSGPVDAMLDRMINNDRILSDVYDEVIIFSGNIARHSPSKLSAIASARIFRMLPKEEIEYDERERKEKLDAINEIRNKPENELTNGDKKILSVPHLFVDTAMSGIPDNFGICEDHSLYYPSSPGYEPFYSLFEQEPNIALKLVRDISNHAITAWRQIHELNPSSGTPIPIDLKFSWGHQYFFGSGREYCWFKGFGAPNPVNCSLLALVYWAHKQLDSGCDIEALLKKIIDGNECVTVLGIALSLALESKHASKTTLVLASCQQLWKLDMARLVQEYNSDSDPMGLKQQKLSDSQHEAVLYLTKRKSRWLEVRGMASLFVFHLEAEIRESYKLALEMFPDNLPYEYEEDVNNENVTQSLMECAQIWKGFGSPENYTKYHVHKDTGNVYLTYDPPKEDVESVSEIINESSEVLLEHNIFNWANSSLESNSLGVSTSLEDAIRYAKSHDADNLFNRLAEAGTTFLQSGISAIAALVIIFGRSNIQNIKWAWSILRRVETMSERESVWIGSHNPWHPALHLIAALRRGILCKESCGDLVERLLRLTIHTHGEVSATAIIGLLTLNKENIRLTWIAAGLASDLFNTQVVEIDDHGNRIDKNRELREVAVESALDRYSQSKIEQFTAPATAWIYATPRKQFHSDGVSKVPKWRDPDLFFNHQFASKIARKFPLESWCADQELKGLFLSHLDQLRDWTLSKVAPSWRDDQDNRRSSSYVDVNEWMSELADLIIRTIQFTSAEEVLDNYIKPFELLSGDAYLSTLADFIDSIVCRQIYDADSIDDDTIFLLDYCLQQFLNNRVFDKSGYRAGEIPGFDIPRLIKAFFFVSINSASGAQRFANGDWKDIRKVMTIVDRLVCQAGWMPFVMEKFLDLCERVGDVYPISNFVNQVTHAIDGQHNSEITWTGLMLPARISGIIQTIADANYPLQENDAKGLLTVLDNLIDMGDRRSAALEQSETFRNIRTL